MGGLGDVGDVLWCWVCGYVGMSWEGRGGMVMTGGQRLRIFNLASNQSTLVDAHS